MAAQNIASSGRTPQSAEACHMKDGIRQTGRREGRERTGFWGLGSWPGSCGDSSTTMAKTRTLAGLLVLVTVGILAALKARSEERRVGKECRSRWVAEQ